MALSILIAKIISLAYLSVGFSVLSGRMDLNQLINEFEKSPALTYLSGIMALILGMLIIEHHNFWVADWYVLITIIGWMALIKGVLLIAYPKFIGSVKGWYQNPKKWGYFTIALGLLFGYFGFF